MNTLSGPTLDRFSGTSGGVLSAARNLSPWREVYSELRNNGSWAL